MKIEIEKITIENFGVAVDFVLDDLDLFLVSRHFDSAKP